MEPMAPAHDRKRTSPAKITDHESTGRLQGMGFHVVRVETEMGSKRAHVVWRNMPDAAETRAVEDRLAAMYERFSHGV